MTNFQAKCQKCNEINYLKDKPTTALKKSPVVRCVKCKQRIRANGMLCLLCNQQVTKCKCTTTTKHVKDTKQTTLHHWVNNVPSKVSVATCNQQSEGTSTAILRFGITRIGRCTVAQALNVEFLSFLKTMH